MAKKKRPASATPSSAKPITDYAAALANPQNADKNSAKNSGKNSDNWAVEKPSLKTVLALPGEFGRGDWTAILLGLMLFFTPALGVPNELMLQDTLKSIIVAFMSLGALFLVFWSRRNNSNAMRWHFVMWLPLMLCVYALGSMFWSHTYLAGVEAIRWFLFAVIVWLVLNSANRERFPMLAWGVHLGALAVALLGASQFWFDNRFIPQGPNPAATFVNRNFAAEFMACTFVFSAYLLFTTRRTITLGFLAASTALNLVFLLMCGTRSAYIGAFISFVMIAIMAWKFRSRFNFKVLKSEQRIAVSIVFLVCFFGLGVIKSGNPGAEFKDVNAFQRGLTRAAQIKGGDATLGVRMVMWKATQTMIKKRPLSGVGAGAWEVDIPLYQAEGSQLETDYYAHNEVLQVIGEYGLVGWLFLLLLMAYSLRSAWTTVFNKTEEGMTEGPMRVVALTSLLALMIVSNIGFPWRLATTGAMFALCLGLLAASDARLGRRGFFSATRLGMRPAIAQILTILTLLSIVLAGYISYQASECENKIVTAVKMALTISQGGNPNAPKNDKTKAEMMRIAKEGIAINPHYRKITPMLGDELAKWGDWKNAVWVWESVVGSRPYVIAMMSNVARGYMTLGNNDKAMEYMLRAKKIQPKALSLRSLEVILLSRTGKEPEALRLAKVSFDENTLDSDMINAAHVLAVRASDFPFAIKAMEVRNERMPEQKVDGLLKIAAIQLNYQKDEAKSLDSYRKAYEASGKAPAVLAQVPAAFQPKLQQ
jgi:O-antigen ligase